MAEKNWYVRFDCADWIMATMTMSPEERGVYIQMLAWSWSNGPIPNSDLVIARIGMGDLALCRRVLDSKWLNTEKGFVNNRLELERVYASAKSANAVVSAKKRWTGNAKALPTECDGNAIHSKSHSNSQSQNQNKSK